MKTNGLLKKLISLAVILMCVPFLGGCGKKSEKEYKGYYLFYIDTNDTKVVYEKFKPEAKTTEGLIDEFIKKMKSKPSEMSMKQVLPDDVQVEDHTMDSKNNLTLYFNSAYSNATGVPEILRRAAIVKNLMQIRGVNAIQIYVSGQPLTDSNMDPVGFMKDTDFIDNTGGETTYTQNTSLTMYFASSSGKALIGVPVTVRYDASMSIEQMVMEQLIKGPSAIKGIDHKKIHPTVPKGTIVNKITVKDSTCFIDLSEDFMNKPDGISDYVAVYSVVDTLTELPGISRVQFSINGEQKLFYNDTLNFGQVFKRNLDIVSD